MKLIFLGPPGAGKGTTAKRLAADTGLAHISTGDLFREAIANATDLGRQVKAVLDRGDLVPDSLTVDLVKDRLRNPDCGKGFVLDGFPRTIPQAEALKGIVSIDKTVNFELADDLVIARLSGRRLCEGCGRNYHVDYLPPTNDGICDTCGRNLVIRRDDQPEAIRNRLDVYKKQTEPLIEYYLRFGLLHHLDAAPPPDTVYAGLRTLVGG